MFLPMSLEDGLQLVDLFGKTVKNTTTIVDLVDSK